MIDRWHHQRYCQTPVLFPSAGTRTWTNLQAQDEFFTLIWKQISHLAFFPSRLTLWWITSDCTLDAAMQQNRASCCKWCNLLQRIISPTSSFKGSARDREGGREKEREYIYEADDKGIKFSFKALAQACSQRFDSTARSSRHAANMFYMQTALSSRC